MTTIPVNNRSISVVGLGKLGIPLAAIFASKGFDVSGIDVNPTVVEMLNQSKSPVYEPGLEDLLSRAGSNLHCSLDFRRAILDSSVTFIVVPTPSDRDGSFSTRYVLESGASVAEILRDKNDYHLIVLTSTVMPGATEKELKPLLEKTSGKKCGVDFGLCYSPEFIALGSAIRDFLSPDFLLIGESDPKAGRCLEELYAGVLDNRPPVAHMDFVNAEVAKIAVNTFITTKISFANMLARICERLPGGNVDHITSAIGLDSRIGTKYLKGAIGYGGPCFPRDNIALVTLARILGVSPDVPEATDHSNRKEALLLAGLVKKKRTSSRPVGILGLAYKPGTNVVEESQGILLAKALLEEDVPVILYDPAAMENARKVLPDGARFAATLEECLSGSQVIVLVTPWPEFQRLPQELLRNEEDPTVLIDCWRFLNPARYEGFTEYVPLGRGML